MKRSVNFMPRTRPRTQRDMSKCIVHRERVATYRYAAWNGWMPMCEECAEWGRRAGHGEAIEEMPQVESK